jgi:hypothetical protein
MKMSKTLADYPGDIVRLACTRCDRRGQYRLAGLIERYGADVRLPDLRTILADCPRQNKFGDPCGVIFPDLVPKA